MKRNKTFALLMLACLTMASFNLFAQEKELQTEGDGYRWYILRQDKIRGAQSISGATLIPLSRGYTFICYHETDGGWFSVKKNDKEGVCDKTGREIVAIGKYDDVNYRNKGGHVFCYVKLNGKNGVCDDKGQEVIAPRYDNIVYHENESNCYFGVKHNGKEGACDISGREVIAPKYDNVCMHGSNGNYYYSVELNGKEGLCDLNGKEIVKPEYDKYSVSYNKEDGYYRMKQNGKAGALDKEGNQIVPPLYKKLRYSSDDFFEYEDESGNWVSLGISLLDTNPSQPMRKDVHGRVLHTQSNGFKWYEIENKGRRGVMNIEGDTVIPIAKAFDSVYYLKNDGGWFGVRKNGKAGVYDLTGREILSPIKYDDAKCFKDRNYLCSIVELNGLCGACDEFGNEIIEPKYDKVVYLSGDVGCLCIELNGKRGICDKTNGNVILAPSKYDFALYNNTDGYEYCMVGIDKKFGVCDMSGREIIAPLYDQVFYYDGYYTIVLNDKKGVCDKNGREIITPKFDNVVKQESDGCHYYGVELNGKSGAYDMKGKEIIKPKYETLIYSLNEFKYQDASGHWVSTGITLEKSNNSSSYASSSSSSSSSTASSNNSSSNNNSGMTREEKVIAVLQALSTVANTIQESRNNNSVTQPQPANNNVGNVAPNQNYTPSNSNKATNTKTKVDNTCLACHGTGKCSFCGGKGTILNQFDGNVYECDHCHGSRECDQCHGRGYKVGYYTP